jgi:hypothetical protein
VIDWLFRNRQTGRITVAQAPNPPLYVFLAALLARRVLGLSGAADTALLVVQHGAAVYWAGDEILRGVNPWRRILGAGILGWQVTSIIGQFRG